MVAVRSQSLPDRVNTFRKSPNMFAGRIAPLQKNPATAPRAFPGTPSRSGLKLFARLIQIFLHLASLGLLAMIATFVQATYTAEWRSSHGRTLSGLLKTDVSSTVAVVQVCQVVLIALNALTLGHAYESLQWSMIDRPGGLDYLDYLALSPTTGIFGTLRLIFGFVPRSTARIWAGLRYADAISKINSLWNAAALTYSSETLSQFSKLAIGAGFVVYVVSHSVRSDI